MLEIEIRPSVDPSPEKYGIHACIPEQPTAQHLPMLHFLLLKNAAVEFYTPTLLSSLQEKGLCPTWLHSL